MKNILICISLIISLPIFAESYLEKQKEATQVLEALKNQQSQIDLLNNNLANLKAKRADDIMNKFSFEGAIEFEYNDNRDFIETNTSNLTLATLELGIGADINKWVKGDMTFLWEGDPDTALGVDAAGITISNEAATPVYIYTGYKVMPFGKMETLLLSDPLILELAETHQAILEVGASANGFTGGVYTYNGGVRKTTEDDKVKSLGAYVEYALERGDLAFSVGASYVDNFIDLAGVKETHNDDGSDTGNENLEKKVGGYAAFVLLDYKVFHFIGEYIKSSELSVNDIAFKGKGATISTYSVELGIDFNMLKKDFNFAIGYQATDEAVALDLDKSRTLFALSSKIFKDTTLAMEYFTNEDYAIVDGGATGKEGRNFMGRLAIGF